MELLFHYYFEKYSSLYVSIAIQFLKDQIVCLNGDKKSSFFGYVALKELFIHFPHYSVTSHKTALWGRMLIELKYWETSDPF